MGAVLFLCAGCGHEKSVTAFRVKEGRRSARCRQCEAAYARERRRGDPRPKTLLTLGLKKCASCADVMGVDSFCIDRNRQDGRNPYCRDCTRLKHRARVISQEEAKRLRDYQRDWKRKHKERLAPKTEEERLVKRFYKMKGKYGLTRNDVDSLVERSGGRCNACSQSFDANRPAHIDHCHSTGRVRGILCRQCNLALGHLGDNPAHIRGLLKYIASPIELMEDVA